MKKVKKTLKVKHLSLKTEKKKAWDAFSKYIRTRDCLSTTGTTVSGKCISCGSKYIFQVLQAGHFIGGRYNGILFDERAVNAQCYSCNIGKKGNFGAYLRAMKVKYGQEVIDELLELDRHKIPVQYKAIDYQELARYYQEKVKELEK